MPKKAYSKTGRACRVTFILDARSGARRVALCGEFNDWNTSSHMLKRRKGGQFSLTLSLPAGRQYRYRYLLDGAQWENDGAADGYTPNPFGGEDSLVNL